MTDAYIQRLAELVLRLHGRQAAAVASRCAASALAAEDRTRCATWLRIVATILELSDAAR